MSKYLGCTISLKRWLTMQRSTQSMAADTAAIHTLFGGGGGMDHCRPVTATGFGGLAM